MSKILITGGSGLVGKNLTLLLKNKGHKVVWLSRSISKKTDTPTFKWDISKNYIDESAFKNVDTIIHLAGAGIAEKRWTDKYKKIIINSRVATAQLLFDYVQKLKIPIKTFITASATGYYGLQLTEKTFTEDSPAADDFLGSICKAWELKAQQFTEDLNIRSVCIRTGVVLSKKGGALEKLTKPISMHIGAPLGSGKQYMPWIHINDLCQIYLKAIETESIQGAYNATAPEHITNEMATKLLAKQLNKTLWLPRIPEVLVKIIFGERACILLKGNKISSEKILNQLHFSFQYATFKKAIKALLAEG